MLAPRWKVKNQFVGDFWHLLYPERHILVPSSEESVPCRTIPGATPDFRIASGSKSEERKNIEAQLRLRYSCKSEETTIVIILEY